jgi:hypothetical protein
MEHVEDGEGSGVEASSRELRLVEQSFFREIVKQVRGRYRRLLIWTVIGLVGTGVVWGFLACPLLHHSIGWCPMGHLAAR